MSRMLRYGTVAGSDPIENYPCMNISDKYLSLSPIERALEVIVASVSILAMFIVDSPSMSTAILSTMYVCICMGVHVHVCIGCRASN